MANSDEHKIHKQKKLNFLYVSIVAHILLGLLAAYIIIQVITPRPKPKFTAAPPSQMAVHPDEHKVKQEKRNNTMSAPAIKRITANVASNITLPPMPDVPTLNTTMGAGNSIGAGLGIGVGTGAGPGGGGVFTPFGLRDGVGLKGEFYDIKQTKDRKPTNMGNKKSFRALCLEFAKTFNEKLFAPYFKAPDPLYASQIFVPNIASDTAAKAFGVDKYVQGTFWFALYKGRVIPPVSGSYRFVGLGDATLVVRFNGVTVLNRGYGASANEWPSKAFKHYYYAYDKDPWYKGAGGHMEGKPFTVTGGFPYDIEILIGDQGGLSQFQVFIEKEGVEYKKDSLGNPIFPIFRASNAPLPDFKEGTVPIYDKEPPAWSIWKLDQHSMFFKPL